MMSGTFFQIPYVKKSVPEWKNLKKDFLSLVDFTDSDCTEFNQPFYSDYCKYYGEGLQPPYHNDLLLLLEEPINWFRRFYPTTQGTYDQFPVPMDIPSSWCQKYTAGQMHPVHTHSIYGWSAIFYAQLGNDHKATNFFSPFPDPWTGFPEEITPSMNEGDMIFFPAQLMHQSLPHRSKEDRIIFSFNLVLSPYD